MTDARPAPEAAGLFPRFLARLLDALIVGLPFGIVMQLVLSFAGIANKTSGVIILTTLSLVAMVAYHVHFESREGRTPGKRVFGIVVTTSAGQVPSVEEAFRRNAWILLGILGGVPAIGFLSGLAQLVAGIAIAVTISSDALTRRGWHDKVANTRVLVDLPS